MRIKDASTPAVVLNCRRQGGLAMLRTLGRLGVPVWSVDSDRFAPPAFSRFKAGSFIWDFDAHSPQESLDFLANVGQKIGRKSFLFPTTDAGTLFVSKNAAILREHFLFPSQSSNLVEALCSKREMFFLARQCGIPTPHATFPLCRADVLDFGRTSAFPLMVKGIDGKRLETRAGKRMYIVHSERELLDLYDRSEDPAHPNLMLQEYIPGGDDSVWMFNGYFNSRSECLFGITGKKIHQFPIHTGLTSLGVCIPNEAVVSLTKTFMRAVGYAGILDIGFRYDARDRTYKVLDVNPRVGATFRLFVSDNGMDVARALYLDLTGQRFEAGAPLGGRKWVVEDLDLVSSARYLWGRELGFREWLRSYAGVRESAFFALDDPAPFLMMFMHDAKQLFKQVHGGFEKSSAPSSYVADPAEKDAA
ncbi:MAG: carboxylate--amine ligase [Acidobacteriota bacterium]|nr:carboxylate--amine ligase [Acidobacteriota bacterium]